MKKRVITIAMTALLCVAPFTAAFAAATYSDVKSADWFYPAVSAMSEKAIISGNPDGTLKLGATLQRAEAASVIWHLADESQRNAPSLEDLRAKALKEQEQKASRTQEQRIQAILDNGPQKITFDPATDETKDEDGRTVMKGDKA